MAIRKFTDINNETNSKYTRYKNTQIKKTIEDVFDTGSVLNSPNDAAIQFLKEKLDDVIDENNDKIVDKQPVFVDTTQTITGPKFFGTTTKLYFRDSGIYLNSNTNGSLQIVSDNKVNIFGKVKIMNSALTASGNISASGDVIANAFIGDGSSLTSLPSQTDNNFTTTLKNKLDGISAGADVTPSWVPSSNPNYLTSVNASDVGLGNVTNESKATMFTNAALTGNPTAPTQTANDDSTKIATTAYVQQELTDLIGTAPSSLDTLGELSASLAADQTGLASLTTTVGTKLAKSSNLSDLTNAGTARTNLGLGSAATNDSGDFAAASHTHAASDITSGTFGASRIPNLAASKITTGTLAIGRISEASVTQHEGALTITEAQISDLGTYSTATGVENNANNYSLPAAASDTRGGVKIGYSENGKNYPVELSSEKMFVNVPWTDTNTTYTVGDGGLTQNNFTDALKTKLDGISTSADVTDATTVAAAGALMDSEVTNLTQVKAFDSSDYATAAQGTKADNALPKSGGTMTGTLQAATLEGASFANRFRKMSVLPGGYVEPNALNFRFDESQTAYAGESHGIGGTINQTSGTTIPDANLKKLFTFTASYINLNTYKDGSGNVVIELTDISLTNSANTSWRPYVFFHSAASNVASMTIELKDGDNNWETVENAIDCIDFYMYDGFYTLSPGVLKGARFTFTNITGNSYLRMIGVIGKTVEPYQWNVLKSGGKMFGDLDFGDSKKVTFGNSEDLQIYHDSSHSYIKDSGTGNLRIDASNFYLRNSGGTKIAIDALDGAEVALRHNNARKLETTSTGVEVTGNITLSGTTTPTINFNGSSDGGIDMAIKATPEGLDFLEPEDGNKIHFQILDDTGVNAVYGLKINNTQVISSGRALSNVTGNISMFTNDSNYLTDYTVTSGDVTAHEGDITITESQISDLGSYATGDNFDADGTFASLRAQGTTKGDVGLGNVPNSDHTAQGYATGDNFDNDGTFASLRAQGTTKGDVGLGNVANESRATILGGNLTGTINSVAVATVTAGAALGATSNQDSTATIRSGTTAANVGLGNVTNESKATMFASPTFTGATAAPTPSANDDSTKIATTAYVQQELTDLIGTAPAALDTLGELSASLANDQDALASLTTTVGTKLAKSSNLSDLADAGTARTNLGLGTGAILNTAAVSDGGSNLATGDQIYDHVTTRISGLTSNTGTVTGVTSGNGNTIVMGGTSTAPTVAAVTNAVSNGGASLATGDQIYDHVTTRISGLTSNTGTVTEVTVGTGLDVSNGTTTPAITLDLSEFTDMTATMASTDEFIVLDNGAERRKAINEIGLNLFSNNAGFLTRADLTRDVINTLPIANGGTGATTAGAALTALGAAASSHTHAASDITSGTLAEARIPDDMDSGKVKQICTSHHNFFMNSPSTSADFFVPFNNLNESSNPTNSIYYGRMVAPYDGRIVKVVLNTTAAIGTSCQVLFWVATSSGVFAPSASETVTGVNLNTANSSATATFSTTSTAEFDEGDVLGVSIIKSSSATANMQVTVVWEYTL